MPKPLFYAGVVICSLLSLCSATQLAGMVPLNASLAVMISDRAGMTRSMWLMGFALVMVVPVAALFLRMASLLAARSLFAAFFAAFSVICTAISFAFVALLQLRLLGLLAAGAAAVDGLLLEVQLALYHTFGWFLSVSLMAIRPYFRIQASRTLTWLLSLPLPFFVWFLLGESSLLSPARTSMEATSMVFWSLLAFLFLAIAVHCLRHRHLFIEATNLRQLLDARFDAATRRRLPYGGVAFDS